MDCPPEDVDCVPADVGCPPEDAGCPPKDVDCPSKSDGLPTDDCVAGAGVPKRMRAWPAGVVEPNRELPWLLVAAPKVESV